MKILIQTIIIFFREKFVNWRDMISAKCKIHSLFVFLVILFVSACQSPESAKPIITEFEQEKQPDQICFDLVLTFIDSSNTKAIVKARRARVFLDSNKTFLDSGVTVQFFNENGKKTGTLTADRVKIDDITKDMFASGKVVAISDSSRTKLETEELDWNNETKKIYSNVYVKITSPSEIIEGRGLESDEQLNNYKIFKVTGIKYSQ